MNSDSSLAKRMVFSIDTRLTNSPIYSVLFAEPEFPRNISHIVFRPYDRRSQRGAVELFAYQAVYHTIAVRHFYAVLWEAIGKDGFVRPVRWSK